MMQRRGFTLIEALSVIAIIGVLASLTIFVVAQAQRVARDATRKSDLHGVAQAFEARMLDRTCTNQSAVGYYPGRSVVAAGGRRDWTKVDDLKTLSDACNPFTYYLPTVPQDPNSSYPYMFNISSGADLDGKHYRLAASLERPPAVPSTTELCRLSDVWFDDFNGTKYDGCGADTIAQHSKSSNWLSGILRARAATPTPCYVIVAAEPEQESQQLLDANCNGVPDEDEVGDENEGDDGAGGGDGGVGGGDGDDDDESVDLPAPVGGTEPRRDYNYYIGN